MAKTKKTVKRGWKPLPERIARYDALLQKTAMSIERSHARRDALEARRNSLIAKTEVASGEAVAQA